MPGPSQRVVTLPKALVDRAEAAAESRDLSTARFIAQAVERALDGPAPSSAPSALTPNEEPVTPTPSGGPAAASGEAPRPEVNLDVLRESIRKDKRRGLETAGREALLAREAARLLIPFPPSASPTSRDVARGPGDARPAEPSASSAPKGGRSPRLEPGQDTPPETPAVDGSVAHAKPEIPPAAAVTSDPARAVPEISTWTCPRCHVEMPLVQRWDHRKTCLVAAIEDREKQTPGEQTTGTPSPPKRQVEASAVIDFILTFTRGSRFRDFVSEADRRAYCAAAVQRIHQERHIEISDAESFEILAALAALDDRIERALKGPQSLAPPSKSTTSPTDKGGARGRM